MHDHTGIRRRALVAMAAAALSVFGPAPVRGQTMAAQAAAAAAATGQAGPVRQLTVEDAVASALEQNLDLQVQRINPQIQDMAISVARSGWTPNFQSNVQRVNQNTQPDSVLSGGQNKVTNEVLTSNYGVLGGFVVPLDPAPSSIYLDPPAFPFGGAGLVSSPRDYDRFLAMLLGEGETGGVRILKPETARLAMSNLLADSVDRKGTFVEGEGFGAGGRVSLASSPTGEGVYGWGGAAGTIAFVDRKRGYRVGGYAQYMPSEALPFQRDLGKAFYKDVMA